MLRITSFIALIAGLLVAVPFVFTNAEAGRVTGVAAKSDRQETLQTPDERLANAFRIVDVCIGSVSGDAESWCRAWHAESERAASGERVTMETRDEAAQTSTVTSVP